MRFDISETKCQMYFTLTNLSDNQLFKFENFSKRVLEALNIGQLIDSKSTKLIEVNMGLRKLKK